MMNRPMNGSKSESGLMVLNTENLGSSISS
jgi:hypothetical protein